MKNGCLAPLIVLIAPIVIFVLVAGGLLRWSAGKQSDESAAMTRKVDIVILSQRQERRAASSDRHGYRITYAYQVNGTTYDDEGFVPLRNWRGFPAQVCVDPDAPALHILRQHAEPRCGTYVGTRQNATRRA